MKEKTNGVVEVRGSELMFPRELYEEVEEIRINEPERFNFLKEASTLNSEQLKKLLSAIEEFQKEGTKAWLRK